MTAPYQEQVSITVVFDWEMGHRLPNHDGHCRNLHGHHYVLHVTVAGPVHAEPGAPTEGMVMDFQQLKTIVKSIINTHYDHKFIISENDPLIDSLKPLPGVIVVPYVPTAENLAIHLRNRLQEHYLYGLLSVKLFETPGCSAEVMV